MPPARKRWFAHGDNAERKKARTGVRLEDVAITPTTMVRYYLALRRVKPVLAAAEVTGNLDELMSSWIEQEFEDGCPLYMIGDTLSAISHFEPSLRRQLTRSWKLFGVWRKYEIPNRAPPLTLQITVAMAGYAVHRGWLQMAALLMLGFTGLLRTGEILAVRPMDFLFGTEVGLVTLPASKTGARHNVSESISIHDPLTLRLCELLVEEQTRLGLQAVPCWTQSGQCFRSRFQFIVERLKLDTFQFRPYSLRRGGATAEFQAHGLMERTLIRGRWKNSSVARLYISDGISHLPRLKMTDVSKQLLLHFSTFVTTVKQA